MTSHHAQTTYQVRLGWGQQGLDRLASSGIVVIVDAVGDPAHLVANAKALAHEPAVFVGTLRNPTATARAIYDEQLARGGRTSINLVLAGDDGAFAVDDYLAAGALADALTSLGIDHSAPDVAVAAEGFRPLTRAVKHLVSASASGLSLAGAAGAEAVREAATLDAETAATRVA